MTQGAEWHMSSAFPRPQQPYAEAGEQPAGWWNVDQLLYSPGIGGHRSGHTGQAPQKLATPSRGGLSALLNLLFMQELLWLPLLHAPGLL